MSRKSSTPRIRPRLEALEIREVPATLVGLTSVGSLVTFDSATPGTLIGAPVAVTGLLGTDVIGGIDYQPSSGNLFGVASDGAGNVRIYTINATTGLATAVNPVATVSNLTGTAFGVDFNPVPNAIRVIDAAGNSTRFSPATGALGAGAPDTDIFYDPNDANGENVAFFGSVGAVPATINVAAAAYTNSSGAIPATATTLYAIDTTLDILVRIGGADGPPSPNTGAAVALAELRSPGFVLVDFGANANLDIQSMTDLAFASNEGVIYSIALSTGTTTTLGTVSGGFSLRGLAIAPPTTGAGTLSLSTSAATFPANRGPVAITVTRTGGATGPVTVDFATVDGTAVGGVDFVPTNGTISFANGETSRTIFVALPAGTPANAPSRSFSLSLSNATGGATLGAATTATLTIPAVTSVPNTFFAVGSTQDARVTVYNTNGGAALFSFRAFEGTFSGEARVAVGDVNGDGFEDVIVGAGPGPGPRIQVFDGRTLTASNQTQIASFFAFDAGFVSGVSVASGDVNGDGFDDVIIGAGAGAGPHVKVFDGRSLIANAPVEIASYFAFADGFVSGVNVAAGQVNGDGFADVIVGAGFGGGSHVKVFSGLSLVLGSPGELASFFAFDAGFIGGVSVGAGDINGDGRTDVIVGSGVGTTSHIKVFNGRTIAAPAELASYFAFEAGFNGGVNTTGRDVNRDGFDDVIVGAGPGGFAHVKYFDGVSLISGPRRELSSFFAADSSFTGGIYVG